MKALVLYLMAGLGLSMAAVAALVLGASLKALAFGALLLALGCL